MKKTLFVLSVLTTLFTSCTSNRDMVMDRPNRMGTIEYRSIEKPNRSIVINSVTFSNDDMIQLERAFGKSIKTIVQNEFSNNNFRVLAREELDAVANEKLFDKNTLGISRHNEFISSDFVVNLKITNVSTDFTGLFVPIIFNNLTHTIEFSVETTIINNRTGEIIGSSGSGRVSYKTRNLLIFIGDINVSISIPLENALKLAIRDAILKSKI